MIKIEELSIGDWVNVLNYHWDGRPYTGQVNGITKKHGTYYLQFGSALSAEIDRCKPIPITKEILEKNGFRLKEEAELCTEYVSGDEHSIITYVFYKESIYDIDTLLDCQVGYVGGLDWIHHCHVKYVHELQHALRLCGINKTIEL
jgi:hypothetical protein